MALNLGKIDEALKDKLKKVASLKKTAGVNGDNAEGVAIPEAQNTDVSDLKNNNLKNDSPSNNIVNQPDVSKGTTGKSTTDFPSGGTSTGERQLGILKSRAFRGDKPVGDNQTNPVITSNVTKSAGTDVEVDLGFDILGLFKEEDFTTEKTAALISDIIAAAKKGLGNMVKTASYDQDQIKNIASGSLLLKSAALHLINEKRIAELEKDKNLEKIASKMEAAGVPREEAMSFVKTAYEKQAGGDMELVETAANDRIRVYKFAMNTGSEEDKGTVYKSKLHELFDIKEENE